MGQLFSSEEEFWQVKDAIGSLLYDAMLEGGALPDLRVVHPLPLANQDESLDSGAGLQEQLRQVNKIFRKCDIMVLINEWRCCIENTEDWMRILALFLHKETELGSFPLN